MNKINEAVDRARSYVNRRRDGISRLIEWGDMEEILFSMREPEEIVPLQQCGEHQKEDKTSDWERGYNSGRIDANGEIEEKLKPLIEYIELTKPYRFERWLAYNDAILQTLSNFGVTP